MMSEQVHIGRRVVPLDEFKNAVEKASRIKEVCIALGFNHTVGTTKQAIKDRIRELDLNTSHFTEKYTMSEAVLNRDRKKYFTLSEDNQKYYDAFEKRIEEKSWGTYKASIGNFMGSLGDKDFATVTIDEMIAYANNSTNTKNILAHLRSLMIFILKNDINGAVDKADRKTMVALITDIKQN